MPDARAGRADRPRASAPGAFFEGWRRVFRAPWIAAGVLAATVLSTLPLAIARGGGIERHLRSLEAVPSQGAWESLGMSGAVAAVGDVMDARPLDPSIAFAVAAYAAVWLFLAGGILDRLARRRTVGTTAFFSACARYFPRFVRLAILVGLCYWAMFRWVRPLVERASERWPPDPAAEPDALALGGVPYVAFLSALAAVNVVADFTLVRVVVEDRRSAIASLVAALRFVRRRPVRVAALYALNLAVALAIMRLWPALAPGADSPLWVVLVAGQMYLLARILARLASIASEAAFFQAELAHAGFSAAPVRPRHDARGGMAIDSLRE